MDHLTRRRLFAMLPLPGIAVALDKILPKSAAPAGASATAIELQAGRRYVMKLQGSLSAEDHFYFQDALNDAGLSNITVVNAGDFDLYDVGPATITEKA